MTDIAIRVENLSKQYKLGATIRHDRLKDLLTHGLTGLFSRNSKSAIRNSQSEYIWALKDVSFEVKRGETLGIIGANGAGKSTLLKILSRITEPTSGRAEIYGRVRSLLEVGTGFDRELTGRENVYLNGAILGMTKNEIDRKFDEIVDFSGVEKFIDTPVKRYSSGMYVRLAFAVAAHLEPEILIVDEVLAVGDAAFQKKCLSKMGEVAKEGRTVLFVSHNLSSICQLCPQSMLIGKGSITYHGESSVAVEHYVGSTERQSAYIAKDPVGIRYISEARQSKSDHTVDGCVSRGDDLSIDIHFVNEGPAFEAALGISIDTREMVRVISDFTLNNNRSMTCNSGVNIYRFRIPKLPLNQGMYFVTVAVHDWESGRILDRRDHSFSFEVVEPTGGYGITRYTAKSGLIIYPCSWEKVSIP